MEQTQIDVNVIVELFNNRIAELEKENIFLKAEKHQLIVERQQMYTQMVELQNTIDKLKAEHTDDSECEQDIENENI